MNKKRTPPSVLTLGSIGTELALLDIEGCLTVRKGEPIPIDELLYLIDTISFVPLALCTGRPQPYAEAMIQLLGEKAFRKPSIVENGCFLYDPMADRLIPHPKIDAEVKRTFRAIKEHLEEKFPEVGIEPCKEVCLSLMPPKSVSVESLFEQVRVGMGDFEDEIFLAHSNSAVDITPKGIDKGAGVRFLCEYLGISPESVVAIGDSNGDLPALRIAGRIGCPGNATPAVKELVTKKRGHVAGRMYAQGTTDVLKHFGIIL
ncbi:MAG: HAD family phosphatase [Parcubacteria group bacterium]|nr:HAD family phosphatase [Parcubacteria group bacterium]